MVERVFLHIGLPKTGTTYLQDVLWSNRDRLRAQDGLVLPGSGHREHLWAALDVQERTDLARRHPRAPGSWERLCAELDGVGSGTGLITHEFLCGASAAQAARAVARLAPARVEVVVTARHAAGMLAAGWQEMVKNGSRADVRTAAGPRRRSEFSWQTWDLHGVLERWSEAVPADRLHVVPMPGPGAPPDQHWRNVAGVLGLTGDYPLPEASVNPSLGAVQVELLRRVNAHLGDFHSALDRGEWIRGYLAERQLVAQAGERFGLPDDLLEECRTRSRRAVDLIEERGFPVVGDVAGLLVPDDLPAYRDLGTVTDAEMLEASTRLVAAMLADLREQRQERAAGGPGRGARLLGRLGRARRD